MPVLLSFTAAPSKSSSCKRGPQLTEVDRRLVTAAFHRARGHHQGLNFVRFRDTLTHEAFAVMPEYLTHRLFRGWNTNGNGELSLSEFIAGVEVATKGSRDGHLALAFRMMSTRGDGGPVSRSEVAQFLECIATKSKCVAIEKSPTMVTPRSWTVDELQNLLFASSSKGVLTQTRFRAILGTGRPFITLHIVDWLPALTTKLLQSAHDPPLTVETVNAGNPPAFTLFRERSPLSSKQRDAVRHELRSTLLEFTSTPASVTADSIVKRFRDAIVDDSLINAITGAGQTPFSTIASDFPTASGYSGPLSDCESGRTRTVELDTRELLKLFILGLSCAHASTVPQVYRALFEFFDEDNCGRLDVDQLSAFLQFTAGMDSIESEREANIIIRRHGGSLSASPSPPSSPVGSPVTNTKSLPTLTLTQFVEVAQRQRGCSLAEVESALLLFHLRQLEIQPEQADTSPNLSSEWNPTLIQLLDSYPPEKRTKSGAFCLLDPVQWQQVLQTLTKSDCYANSSSEALLEETTELPSGHMMLPLSVWLIVAFWYRMTTKMPSSQAPNEHKAGSDCAAAPQLLGDYLPLRNLHFGSSILHGYWIRVSLTITSRDGLERSAIFPQILVFERCTVQSIVDAALFQKSWHGGSDEVKDDSTVTKFYQCQLLTARCSANYEVVPLVSPPEPTDIPQHQFSRPMSSLFSAMYPSWTMAAEFNASTLAFELHIAIVEVQDDGQKQQPSEPPAAVSDQGPSTRNPEFDEAPLFAAISPQGLANLGNTCFMNSALQCLAATPLLREYFLHGNHHRDTVSVSSTLPSGATATASSGTKSTPQPSSSLSLVFGQLLTEMNGNASEVSATVDAIAPTDLHKAFAALYPHLCDGTQQDAQEFLVCLLGRLGDELKRHPTPKRLGELSILSPRSHALLSRLFSRSKEAESKGSNDNDGAETDAGRLRFCMEDSNGRHDRLVATEWWVSHLVNEPSVVTALFSGQFKSVLTCDRCTHQSARFEPFSSLQLPLEDGADTEALSTLTDQEGSLLDVVVIVHFADSLKRRGGPRGALRLAVHVKRHAALADVLSQLPQTRRASDSALSRRYVVGSLQGLTIDHLVVEEGVGNQLEADTPAISLPTPTHVFELTNIVGNGDDTAAPTASSTPLYLRFLHRRTVLVPFYCTTPSRQALCGSPFVCCSVLGALTGQALYRVVRQRFQLGGDTPFVPHFSDPDRSPQSSRYTVTFMLRRVREGGVACSRCHWSSGCRGCRILPSTTAAELLDLGSHESIAIDWELHSDSQQLQTFWWLQVPPPTDDESYVRYRRIKTHPLMRSLHSLCSTEHLEAACSQCHPGVPTPHTKQLTLWSLPPLLVLQLKRFELSAGQGGNFHWKKLTHNVDFPIHGLDLSDLLAQVDGSHGDSEPCGPRCISGVVDTRVRRGLEFLQDELGVPLGSASRSCALYDLYAVVNHSGSGLSSGHYTAHVRSANSECWWLADDAKVTSMAAEELAPSTAAYLLFYVRRDVAAGAKDLSDLFPRRQDAPEAANAAGEAETPRPRRPAEQHRCVMQ